MCRRLQKTELKSHIISIETKHYLSKNWLRIDKDIAMSLVSSFFWDTV